MVKYPNNQQLNIYSSKEKIEEFVSSLLSNKEKISQNDTNLVNSSDINLLKKMILQFKMFQASLDEKPVNDHTIHNIEIKEPLFSISKNFLVQLLMLLNNPSMSNNKKMDQDPFIKLQRDISDLFKQKIENDFSVRSSNTGIGIGISVAFLAVLATLLILTASGPITAAILGFTLLGGLLVFCVSAFITSSIYSKVKSDEKKSHIDRKYIEINQITQKISSNAYDFFSEKQNDGSSTPKTRKDIEKTINNTELLLDQIMLVYDNTGNADNTGNKKANTMSIDNF